MPENRWNNQDAPDGDDLAALVYRSRTLASDRSVVNIYGGNTSTKTTKTDHLGRETNVLWVKGSGSDMASINELGFAGLKLDEVLPLFERIEMSDEAMVDYLERTVFEPGRPRQSIETLLHAFIPAKHVDHTHPDAIITLACTPDGERLVKELYGERAAWVPYLRPGFALSKRIGKLVRDNPALECIVMGKHGLVTWDETSKACYEKTIRIIQEAEEFIARRSSGLARAKKVLSDEEAERLLARVLPPIRGVTSGVLAVDRDPEVLDFVGSEGAEALSQTGAACPDHLVHTKHRPLFVGWQPGDSETKLLAMVQEGLERYQEDYRRFFETHAGEGDTMFPPNPRVILIPGLGLIAQGRNAASAEVTRQLYRRAIAVMRGARALGGFVSLSDAEAFAVEYWPLELYKLSLKPAPKTFEGKVALVTGGASGIGRAVAESFADAGAHVVIVDLNEAGATELATRLESAWGSGQALGLYCDVTSEENVAAVFKQVVLRYGGVDIVVSNAGIAASAPVEETSLAMWETSQAILSRGYFLVAREAFKLWRAQGSGGNLVFVTSKNSVVAGKNVSAYSAAKAAELHLARCLAEEGGAAGIRVNCVLPDAVLSGSSIWNGAWRAERAATYGIPPERLEDFYCERTTLKVNVYPEDVAQAVLFFAGPGSSKTTGGILTVDGGVPAAYAR
jgi:rhamnulose-1-phosphate aldolase/alcohol dehydrogenase